MKILFTSVGRRVELISTFRRAAARLCRELTIFGADISDSAPALCFCDEAVIAPPIRSQEYIPFLLELCKSQKIDCIIPTIDTDLLVLSENKGSFEATGVRVLISSADKIKICRDKGATALYFKSLGLNAPDTLSSIDEYDGTFPAFIRPKDGSSSVNAYRADNADELKYYADRIAEYVISPFVEGREFTVDVLCDLCGNPIFITPRERLTVRAGEVLKTEICQDDSIIDEIKNIIRDFSAVGPITVQLIKDRIGRNFYIEINPRFGGGAPLSMKAGADSAEMIIRMLDGERIEYQPYAARDKEVYCRFDDSVCVKAGIKHD